MKNKHCCFTGHRDIDKTKETKIKNKLSQIIEQLICSGYTDFAAGGAEGFDRLCAEAVLKLKEKYPHIKLHLFLPYRKKNCDFRADSIEYASEAYWKGCFFERNRRLVDYSSYCVCLLEKESGGTFYTVNYANKQGVEVLNIKNLL